jgi:hypothetical protein
MLRRVPASRDTASGTRAIARPAACHQERRRSRATLRVLLVLAFAATSALVLVQVPGMAATAAQTDPVASGQLRAAFDEARTAAGFGPYFTRPNFQAAAVRDALALANGLDVTSGPDQGHGLIASGTASPDTVDRRISGMIGNLAAVNQIADLTDGGWSVATRVVDANTIAIGMAVWDGVPQPPVGRSAGCTTTGGFCWRSYGLNVHLPWIRNRLRWYVSTSGLTTYRLRVARRALAMVNAIPGIGLDVAYGGRTTALGATTGRRFVLRWMTTGRACGSTVPRACFRPGSVDGEYNSGTIQVRANAMRATSANLDDWTAVLAHELLHSLGLAHYDAVYSGHYQLMRSVAGALAPQLGDRRGADRMARPGRLSASLTLPSVAVPAGGTVVASVRTASDGLGGVRSISIECTDSGGVYRIRSTVSGVWDIAPRTTSTPWTVSADETAPYTAMCRALVRSKGSSVTSAPATVQVGGSSP